MEEWNDKEVVNMKTKKILVTGGAGFIGTNLCNELRSGNMKWFHATSIIPNVMTMSAAM